MGGRFKNRFAIGAAALAAAAFAGGAYAASQSGSDSRKAFINDVAKRLNVSPDQLKSAFRAALVDRLNAAVKAGRLSQAEANAIEQRINHGELPLFFGPRHHFGHGLRHGPLRGAADYLGLTQVQLFDQLRSGKSLAQVAKDKGKTTAGLEQAMTAEFKSRLDKAVSAGRVSKQQEQTILDRFQSRLGNLVNRTPPRFGGPRHLHAIPGGPPWRQGGPGGPPWRQGGSLPLPPDGGAPPPPAA